MTPVTSPAGTLLPCLQPSGWDDRQGVLCEPLIADQARWDGEVQLPWIAYGVDRGETFEFLREDPEALVEMRCAARASLCGIPTTCTRLEYDGAAPLEVLDISGHYFAAEKVLDPGLMRDLQVRLASTMLAVAIPMRGHLYVTQGVQDEHALRRFLHLVGSQHRAATQPLFELPLIVQDGAVVGVIRLMDDEDPDGDPDEEFEVLHLLADGT